MELLNVIFLSLIQGITEFLPVSSSAHLILFPTFSGNKDQGLLIDISVHLGSLIAVTTFFWTDVRAVIASAVKFFSRNLVTGWPWVRGLFIACPNVDFLTGVCLDVLHFSENICRRSVHVYRRLQPEQDIWFLGGIVPGPYQIGRVVGTPSSPSLGNSG